MELAAAIGIAGMMVSIAACGSSDNKSGGSDKGADAKALTVWLTVDAQNNWPELVKAPTRRCRRRTPASDYDEYYGWPDKNTKLDAVLATDKAPDVVEMGNTEMLGYMVKGAFAPIDASKLDNSAAWLDGLKASVTYDGKTYGVPYYAGGRVGNGRRTCPLPARCQDAPEDVHGTHLRPGQDPEEGGEQVQRLVPADARLVRRDVLRLRRRRLHRQGGRRPVEGQPVVSGVHQGGQRLEDHRRQVHARRQDQGRVRPLHRLRPGQVRHDLRRRVGGCDLRGPEERQDRQAQGQPRELRDARPVREDTSPSSSAVPTSPSR